MTQEDDKVTISKSELERLVDQHCNDRLGAFGIDWQSPEGVREFLKDQLFLREWRQAAHRTAKIGWLTFVGILVSGALGLLYAGLLYNLSKHP